MSRDSNDVLFV